MSTPFGGHVRIALIVEEYRLTGFGVQGDRVVFILFGEPKSSSADYKENLS
ncbi:hypothetical protein BV25DRAFT_1922903 [Artomyces pyxidatus]|uniref:Uncharacterized protein n=1 Tax=Artomyces pyxidatus TaxID=48021 RepID=A0ACB8SEN7_9AGAM|nr:hypothetical protein BV25DRAFT_1922903 [Artomyces pyxidatus]